VEDGFPEKLLAIPTISAEWEDIVGYPLEVGNRKVLKERTWYIDIFAKNKSQRDEFAYQIFNALDDGVPVYDYNEGFPENGVTPSRLGSLIPITRRIKNIEVNADLTDELYYRAAVIFEAVYDQF